MKPNDFDPLWRPRSSLQQHRPAPAEVAATYTDAELYRIVVAQALTNGTAATKAEFDAKVRKLGNLKGANELIALRNIRFGCHAWRHGDRMHCECGATWRLDDVNPPQCRREP